MTALIYAGNQFEPLFFTIKFIL